MVRLPQMADRLDRQAPGALVRSRAALVVTDLVLDPMLPVGVEQLLVARLGHSVTGPR